MSSAVRSSRLGRRGDVTVIKFLSIRYMFLSGCFLFVVSYSFIYESESEFLKSMYSDIV